jgi:hypothetical protein
MGYLSNYEHDIFVSYAHSDFLNLWSVRLIQEVRQFVAGELGLREDEHLDLWWDYKIAGNQPLTAELRRKVARSGLLLVLMSDWYLDSSWCRDELEWFLNTIRQERAGRPVFVVRVRETDHNTWPEAFKDERGHPLPGYNFVRAVEAKGVGPKGYPRPEDAADSKDYYEELSKLASDIVQQLRSLGLDVPSDPNIWSTGNPARSTGSPMKLTDNPQSTYTYSEAGKKAGTCRRVFVMADECDTALAREIRHLVQEREFLVCPRLQTGTSGRDAERVKKENRFLNLIRKCRGIVLIHGSVKEIDDLWIEDRIDDIEFVIQPRLGGHPPWAIIDAPPPPRLDQTQPYRILASDSPAFEEDLQTWLDALREPLMTKET